MNLSNDLKGSIPALPFKRKLGSTLPILVNSSYSLTSPTPSGLIANIASLSGKHGES